MLKIEIKNDVKMLANWFDKLLACAIRAGEMCEE